VVAEGAGEGYLRGTEKANITRVGGHLSKDLQTRLILVLMSDVLQEVVEAGGRRMDAERG